MKKSWLCDINGIYIYKYYIESDVNSVKGKMKTMTPNSSSYIEKKKRMKAKSKSMNITCNRQPFHINFIAFQDDLQFRQTKSETTAKKSSFGPFYHLPLKCLKSGWIVCETIHNCSLYCAYNAISLSSVVVRFETKLTTTVDLTKAFEKK